MSNNYAINSKWSSNTNSSIDSGSVEKFIRGVQQIIALRFENFNQRIKKREEEISEALLDTENNILLCIVYSGDQQVAREIKNILEESVREMNGGIDETFSYKIINQKELHEIVKQDGKGASVDFEFTINNWGEIKTPYEACYGRVSAQSVASWYSYKRRIFDKNIRFFLEKSLVNKEIEETLLDNPENFWYFNNGITILCDNIQKSAASPAPNSNVFKCFGMNIVNGAQTVGSIAKAYEQKREVVGRAEVIVRIISLNNCPETFGDDVTRSNNTQNRTPVPRKSRSLRVTNTRPWCKTVAAINESNRGKGLPWASQFPSKFPHKSMVS